MKDVINNLQTVWVLARAFTKRFFRDKIALFFTFAFPLLFLVIFGFIFGGNSDPSFKVAVINNSSSQFATDFRTKLSKGAVFKVSDTVDFDKAKEQIGRGELDAIIELPSEFGNINNNNQPSGVLKTFYDESDESLAITLKTVLQGTLDAVNEQFVTINEPFVLEAEPIKTANLSRFDYILAGLIGFTILSLGIFSMSEGFLGDKKAGALRRMQVSPISPWQLILATAINRVFVGILSVGLMYIVALSVFGFDMRGDYFNFLVFTIIGTICMFGFGMAIAGWARDANQAAPLTQMITLPMMFLSGVFFPTFLMPSWLQSITQYIPLTPIIDGLRLILTEGKTILDLGEQLLIIGVWIVIIYVISFKVFRWE